MSISLSTQAAKRSAGPILKVTPEEAAIIHLLLERVDLSMDEVASFSSLQASIEQVVSSQRQEADDDKLVNIQLTEENIHNLLVFMQRVVFRGGGARQVNAIVEKAIALLPQGDAFRVQAPLGPPKVELSLRLEERLFLRDKLQSIQISVPELRLFLSVYDPLEVALLEAAENKELVLRISEQGLAGLRTFIQRFELLGCEVKLVKHIQKRLEPLS